MTAMISTKVHEDTAMIDALLTYTRRLWLLSLGIYARTEQEANRLFAEWVGKGKEVETDLKQQIEQQAAAMRDRIQETQANAIDYWQSREQWLRDWIDRILIRVGAPTQDDMQGLSRQVEALHGAIQALVEAEKQKALPGNGSVA